jgi:hypothetical protein
MMPAWEKYVLSHRPSVIGSSLVSNVMWCSPDGPPISTESEATDLIGDALGEDADVVVLPIERLTADFFQLRTGLAGAIAQKFVNYRIKLVVVGDTSTYTADSAALRDFIYETNRGNQLWFLNTLEELTTRLGAR